jgi:sugar lactone lactonase YvrE
MAELFDDRLCDLGEGPIWHQARGSLLWFDINAGRLLERQGETPRYWQFEGPVTAAGVLPDGDILIASHVALQRFNLETGSMEIIEPLEEDVPETRSNDGRPDAWGGFWIGTMGRAKQPGYGAIYRFFGGELRKLHSGITISNAICFAPDRSRAYFTDTPKRVIWQQALDEKGWPAGGPEVFVDLTNANGTPDGAVCDADGYVWSARWGSGEVVRHAPDGRVDTVVSVPASQVTCPAFGGPDARTLYCTTARETLSPEALRSEPLAGATFKLLDDVPGRFEPQVIL